MAAFHSGKTLNFWTQTHNKSLEMGQMDWYCMYSYYVLNLRGQYEAIRDKPLLETAK